MDEVDISAVRSVIHRGLLIGMLAGLPAAGVLVIAEHLIRGLFAYGAFDLAMVYPTALVLMAYGVGIPAFILVKTLQPAFYAAGDAKTPMWITIISVIINIGLKSDFDAVSGGGGISIGNLNQFMVFDNYSGGDIGYATTDQ